MAYCAYCGSHVPQVSYAPCASCTYPTNGAPRAPRSNNTAMIIGGVVIGAVVLFMIVGILGAIAIPNFLTAMQRSRQKRSMADMRAIATQIEVYVDDRNAAPKATSIEELQSQLNTRLPANDGWGTPYRYESADQGYVISSAGSDKKFDDTGKGGPTQSFDCDIIFANGNFVQYPEGVQP